MKTRIKKIEIKRQILKKKTLKLENNKQIYVYICMYIRKKNIKKINEKKILKKIMHIKNKK